MAINLGVRITMSFECSPYLWTNTEDAQRITETKRSTNKHAYDMSCNAILESKLMLVKFDPWLSFFTHTRGYLNHVRQALHARWILVLVCMKCKAKFIYKFQHTTFIF